MSARKVTVHISDTTGFHTYFCWGEGVETFMHGTVNWMRAKHAQLGRSGGMPIQDLLCCTEIESGELDHLKYPNNCDHNRFTYNKPIIMLYFVVVC